MGTNEESLCPQCSGKGQKNRVIAVFYKSQNALYTCEDKTCTYFVTDAAGNLVKFNKQTNTTSYILDRPTEHETVDDELDSFFDSLNTLNNDFKGMSNNYSYPVLNAVQAPVSQPRDNNSSSEVKNENSKNTDSQKLEEVFQMDCSSLNFDDFLYN